MYCMINPFFYYEIIVNYMDRICFLIFKLVYKLLDLSIQKVMCILAVVSTHWLS